MGENIFCRTVHFRFERETPGAVLYQETDANGHDLKADTEGTVIRTLYVRKRQLNGAIPKHIRADIYEWIKV